MRLKLIISLLAISVSIFGVFFISAPSQAATREPAGKVPVLEPLQAPPQGMKPNYSKSVNSISNEAPPPDQPDQNDIRVADPEVDEGAKGGSGHTWVWLLTGVIVAVGIAAILVKKKVIQFSGKNEVAKLLLAALFIPTILLGFSAASTPQVAMAQSIPPDGRTIQRTIIDEEELKTPVQKIERESNSATVFGVGAILLLIIALVASMVYWSKYKK